ncbi:hypothetical protein MPTK1_6g04160 [Marchantia polymorpha subsp. ruderalis]|uniref:Uncharacterized protein n=2 Tax=Marchantia polymorpha TaxID=3197 RepID=A0AAF6BND4_MARPO|nr:hypothetical protein MARPO_0034s0102 [Marchantia polymorpha]BBN13518.1 hypothetical protein Mp_6g04160 [Marchantia polymorpha subsp. ruderalis]|eukprot:PTQ41521.1 hypothetical protein MARPO_0034s0102 [Marchantia polymorpha]
MDFEEFVHCKQFAFRVETVKTSHSGVRIGFRSTPHQNTPTDILRQLVPRQGWITEELTVVQLRMETRGVLMRGLDPCGGLKCLREGPNETIKQSTEVVANG